MDLATGIAEVFDLQHSFARFVALVLVEISERPAHHHLDEAFGGKLRPLQGADVAAVAQDAHAVGQSVDLGHAVADVDDGESILAQLPDQLEKPLRLAVRERRCRLVHDEHAALAVQRPGDFHLLLLRDGQPAGGDTRIETRPEPGERLAGGALHRGAIHEAAWAGEFLAEKNVFGDGEVRGQADLLINQRDA